MLLGLLQKSGTTALRPVTIHQVLSADQAFGDAEFMIDGQEAKEVSRSKSCLNSKKGGHVY